MIYAHRGASGYAPENTLEAFELAARQSAYGVELDVQLSRDGIPVVVHDETIDRVSDGSGYVSDMTVAELKKFRFNRTRPGYENARMPTLQEVFELLYPLGLSINIELKNSLIEYAGMEKIVVELAAKHNMTDRILYSSFNHRSMAHMKEIDPKIPCALLYSCMMMEPWEYAARYHMNALHPYFRELLVPGECERAHALGIEVNPWTVDTEEDLAFVMKAGADRVISNYPDRALAVAAAMAK